MKPKEIKGLAFDPNFSYVEEASPLTPEDWNKHLEILRKRYDLPRSKLLYGSWLAESEEEKQLRELAETYHTRCDAYDKHVCTGTSPRTGESIPMNGDQAGAVNRYALDQRDTALLEGRRMGFTEEQVVQAIRNYAKKHGDIYG